MEPAKDEAPLTPDEAIDLLAGITNHVKYDVKLDNRKEPVLDHSIGISERNLYGYTYSEMLSLQDKRALELFNEGYPVYLLYPDGTESLALEQREITNHMGIFGIERNQWKLTQDYEFEKMNMQSGAMLFWPVLEG